MRKQRIALTREALYREVWSEPIVHVASRLGLSGRGLGKLCARHEIPVPPRGWWAKKQHGHRVRQIPLPATSAKEQIVFEPRDIVEKPEDPPEITREKTPEWRIEVPEDLAITHALVKQAAAAIRKSSRELPKNRVVRWQDRYQAKLVKFWADLFPKREPEHFVFPSERYGAGGNKFEPTVYSIDPARAINSWKEAWETVKENTGITIRFHDLRHTCVTRMLEGGVPLSVVASILGWSPATTARMAKRYGHIGHVAQRQAVAVLDAKPPKQKKKKSSRVKAKPSARGRHKNGHSEEASLDGVSAKH